MTRYHIDFEPVGLRGDCPRDQSLLDAAQRLGVGLVSLCGGNGSCGRCKVQVLTGLVSEPTSAEEKHLSPEELEEGYRLACQTVVSSCQSENGRFQLKLSHAPAKQLNRTVSTSKH